MQHYLIGFLLRMIERGVGLNPDNLRIRELVSTPLGYKPLYGIKTTIASLRAYEDLAVGAWAQYSATQELW